MFVENSEDLIWTQPTAIGDGSIVFYRVVKESNTDFNESLSKDALKLVLANALKKAVEYLKQHSEKMIEYGYSERQVQHLKIAIKNYEERKTNENL